MAAVRRPAFLLLIGFTALAESVGLETILGAFAAGALLSLLDRDETTRPADLEEIIVRSLAGLGPSGRTVRVDLPPGLPKVVADPPVMERVIANLTANVLRYSPAGSPPRLTASAHSGVIELHVIDCGPGVPWRTGRGCSRPSSGSATPAARLASGSGSQYPAA